MEDKFCFVYKALNTTVLNTLQQLKYCTMKNDIFVLTQLCCASSCSRVKPRESYEHHKSVTA